MMNIQFDNHIDLRACQRNFSMNDLEFIIRYGHRIRRTGVIYCQMRRKDMPQDIPPNDPRQRLIGSTVILDKDARAVITAYRNPEAFKRDRRKAKYARDNREH